LRIRITTGRKGLVVDPSAFLKHLLKDTALAVGEIDAIFEGVAHVLSTAYIYLKHNVCSNQSSGLKQLKQAGRAYIPRLKPVGFTLYLCKVMSYEL
jgi:hypothetical protein